MNINPSLNVDTPHCEENNKGDGMRCEKELILNRLESPVVLTPDNATFDDIAIHGQLRQRLSTGTINRNLRYLRYMASFEPKEYAVDILDPNRQNFFHHMDYREQMQGAGWGALKHQWQAMIMALRAFGIDYKSWHYRPPHRPRYQVIPIPLPKQLHKMIHLKYNDNEYTNALIKTLLLHNYYIGWRVPSEPTLIKIDDVDLENKILKITSPKLYNATRQIDIDEIATRHTTFSFKNYIDIWRPKVENQYSNDFLYLKPDGKPFTIENLRMFLNRKASKTIKTIFPEYYNYTSRHFSAIAHLIRTKIQTDAFDVYEVKEHMGHTKIETTIGYLQHAKFYYDKYPFDWLCRVLKWHNVMPKENSIKHKNTLVTSGKKRSGTVTPSADCYAGFIDIDCFDNNRLLQPISFFFSFEYNYEGDIFKIDLPETDYCNVAFFRFSIRAGLSKDGLSETFSSDGIKSSSPPPFQIDQNIQSDCRDGANYRLVMKGVCIPFHLHGLLHLASHMGDGILKRVFNLSSPPSIPFLCLLPWRHCIE